MTGDARRFAACLNGIGDGMARAVEERTKSERMRTELITNVSHDIKTPLTSIVNYVDLMKKENVTGEPMRGYIEVLERQAARLKKLTEDLIEASKAASGVVPVQLETCDWSVLLDQALGEYDGKLRAAGLEVIRREPEGAVTVTADGRLVWRVMDNLLGNIVKDFVGICFITPAVIIVINNLFKTFGEFYTFDLIDFLVFLYCLRQ